MKLAIVNQISSAGGGARFTRALVKALASTFPDDLDISVFTDASTVDRDAFASLFGDAANVTVVPISDIAGSAKVPGPIAHLRKRLRRSQAATKALYWLKERRGVRGPAAEEFALSQVVLDRLAEHDVIYLAWPYFIEPFDCRRPVVVTTHDFNFKYPFGNFSPDRLALVELEMKEWVERAASITVSSAFIESELRRFYPSVSAPVDVIRLVQFSVSDVESEMATTIRARLGVPSDYVICPSNTSPHKNLGNLIRAAGEIKRRGGLIPLVLTGYGTDRIGQFADANPDSPLNEYGSLTRAIKEEGLELGRDVIALGYVSDTEVDALIQGARLLVAPSKYEAGSGPAVDAWASATPVAFSRIPPFVEQLEYLGTHAYLFDPDDTLSMAKAISDALADPAGARERARESQVALARRTWTQIAHEYRMVFERVLKEQPQ